jgi:sulfane dehydrogenase subunit SoxC
MLVPRSPFIRGKNSADAPWSLEPGAVIEPYQRPSGFEKNVVRTVTNPNGQPGASAAKTPHHPLKGTITPNGLHFVVVYGGVPDIDPDKHRLVIHGLVKRPLVFTLEALARYPMVTRVTFLECGGNSAPLFHLSRSNRTCRRCTGWLPAPSGRV